MNTKSEELKEKLRQALNSTAKVISDDFEIKENLDQNKSSKEFNFFNLENLNSKSDFIKARAESDSNALKKKFSNDTIYNKNLPCNSSYISLSTSSSLTDSPLINSLAASLVAFNCLINSENEGNLIIVWETPPPSDS